MQDHEKAALYLIVIGIVASLGRLLSSKQKITPRLVIGRALMGSIMSLPVGLLLPAFPDVDPFVLIAAGAAFGILGEQWIEAWLSKKIEGGL